MPILILLFENLEHRHPKAVVDNFRAYNRHGAAEYSHALTGCETNPNVAMRERIKYKREQVELVGHLPPWLVVKEAKGSNGS
jgi:hypothetical protein